jgi:hypothetical protein
MGVAIDAHDDAIQAALAANQAAIDVLHARTKTSTRTGAARELMLIRLFKLTPICCD